MDNKPKPIFVNTTEQNVPQPPQLQKKPQPVFEKPTVETKPPEPPKEENSAPTEEKKPEEAAKKNYDDLFGNGIV
jgi:hypothetical protein